MVRDARRVTAAGGSLVPPGSPAPPSPTAVLELRERALRAAAGLRRVRWTLPFVGFLVYSFVMLTYWLPLGQASLIVAAIGLLFQGRVRFPTFVVLFAIFLAWAGLGLVSAEYGSVASKAWEDRLKLGVIMLVTVNAIQTRAQMRFALMLFVVSFIAFPARASIIMYNTGTRLGGRAIGPHAYNNPNDLAAVCLLAMAIGFALFASEPKKSLTRLGALVAVCTLVMLTLMTQSRGAFLGMVVILGPYVFARVRRQPKSLIIFVVAGLLAVAFAPAGVWERVGGLRKVATSSTMREVDEEGSAAQRYEIIQTGLRIIRDNPVMGVGIGSFPFAHRAYNPLLGRKDSHNSYLGLTAETGIPGALIFVGMLVSVLTHARRVRKSAGKLLPEAVAELRCLELGLLGFLVAGIFGSYLHINFPYPYMGLLYACAETVRRELRVMRQPATAPQPQSRMQRFAALRAR